MNRRHLLTASLAALAAPLFPRGIAFATARLAVGASALRDMIVMAWEESAETPVGYPMVNLRDIESGKMWDTRGLFGAD